MIEQHHIDTYLDAINQDYINWSKVALHAETQDESIQRFKDNLKVTVGKKYIKVIKEGSVHSFIVNAPDAKFKVGDVLMAATYNTPSRNKARGNVIDGTFKVNWTGANYLI